MSVSMMVSLRASVALAPPARSRSALGASEPCLAEPSPAESCLAELWIWETKRENTVSANEAIMQCSPGRSSSNAPATGAVPISDAAKRDAFGFLWFYRACAGRPVNETRQIVPLASSEISNGFDDRFDRPRRQSRPQSRPIALWRVGLSGKELMRLRNG